MEDVVSQEQNQAASKLASNDKGEEYQPQSELRGELKGEETRDGYFNLKIFK